MCKINEINKKVLQFLKKNSCTHYTCQTLEIEGCSLRTPTYGSTFEKLLQTCMHISLDFLDPTYFQWLVCLNE